MRDIVRGELEVGKPLPWDVYGDGGGLLARKGYQIANDAQIEALLKRGKIAAAEQGRTDRADPPSVLRMINAVNRRLAMVLAEIALGRCIDAPTKLAEIARYVIDAVELQPDVALACILHNQDAGPYAVRHSVDTAIVSQMVARAMKFSEDQILDVTVGALCMNVGMLEHQERMQCSKEPLNHHDQTLIQEHPEAGADLLRKAGVTNEAWLQCVLLHHENENGTGYPFGRLSRDIPQLPKIISLADRYCARISTRHYRKSMLPNAALRDILLEGKATIDPSMAAVFIRELGVYPIGTFVRLINGEIGVVTRKGLNTTTPIVDSLVGPRGAPLDVVIRRDTKNELHSIREVLNAAQAAIGFNLDQLWGRVASA